MKIKNEGLKNLTNLTKLNLSGNRNVTDEALSGLRHLHTLQLFDNEVISEEALLQRPLLVIEGRRLSFSTEDGESSTDDSEEWSSSSSEDF